MYSSGRTVDVAGVLSIVDNKWELSGSSGSPLCVLPSEEDLTMADTWNGMAIQMRGRLVWNTAVSSWCLDKAEQSNPALVATSSIDDVLIMLSANPSSVFDSPGQHYIVSAYMKYALEPSVEDESAYFADSAGYTPGWTSIAVTIPEGHVRLGLKQDKPSLRMSPLHGMTKTCEQNCWFTNLLKARKRLQ